MPDVEGETLIWSYCWFLLLSVERFLGLGILFLNRLNKLCNFLENVDSKIIEILGFLKVVEILNNKLLTCSIANF